jgi:arginyl-tRNA--protein-N-Asp/Glu arginylyltransferase
MSLPNEVPLHKLQFYVTSGYSCGYLPGKLAQSLIAAPQHLINANVYSGLIQQGFRRSGKFAYRPHCDGCRECVAVRINVQQFQPNKSQKRAQKRHQNLDVTILPIAFYEEHHALYQAYQAARHSEDLNHDADQGDAEQYRNFLCQTNVDSVMVEFRELGILRMVSVIDLVHDGISAVYTFYDTQPSQVDGSALFANLEAPEKPTSYGTYNILWQVEWAKQLKLPYLYLGYWIRESQKMAYKQNFKPLEKLIDGEWVVA